VQLLDSEQLEYAFQLHGITLEAQARQFYANVWGTIQRAEKARDQKTISEFESELRSHHQSYFATVHEWRLEEEERNEGKSCCALSRENAREAHANIPLFEKQFLRYAMCYLELNRALIRTRVQISTLAQDCNLDDPSMIMSINHGTGALLSRAHKERHAIMEKRLRIERARSILQVSDPIMEELGADLPHAMGLEGDHQLTLFKGALRKSDFAKAEKIASTWKSSRLAATGRILTAIIRRNAGELTAQDGLMLHSGELSLITAFLRGDEAKINDFMNKHNVPYMVFQYKNLIHLGYTLGKIGSIEGLIIQHAKLVMLAARPHADADYAKTQEQTVLMPARALLQSKFTTLGAIFDEMETILIVLEKLFAQTKDYMAHTPS